MEPFRLDRQAKAFLAVLIALALVLVPLAPFASLVFAGLSLVVLCLVLLMALARNRRFFGPLTRVEGALAVSAAVFAVAGALVIAYATIMLGTGNAMMLSHAMLPFSFTKEGPRPVGTSSRSYGDAETQERFKQELARAGIPFEVESRDGKEWVGWTQDYNAAVEAIHLEVSEGPLPAGRSMGFGDPAHHKEFAEWLARKGVKSETVRAHGKEYLVWEEGAGEPLALMNEFHAERAKKCKEEKKTAQALGTGKCS